MQLIFLEMIKFGILLFTFRERYQKPRWWKPIPETHKLTENDITRFVESMKTTLFTSMFSKYGSADAAVALKHLSTMRPELIVPPLLEKYDILHDFTCTVELQWLEHLRDHENMFKTELVQANEC